MCRPCCFVCFHFPYLLGGRQSCCKSPRAPSPASPYVSDVCQSLRSVVSGQKVRSEDYVQHFHESFFCVSKTKKKKIALRLTYWRIVLVGHAMLDLLASYQIRYFQFIHLYRIRLDLLASEQIAMFNSATLTDPTHIYIGICCSHL